MSKVMASWSSKVSKVADLEEAPPGSEYVPEGSAVKRVKNEDGTWTPVMPDGTVMKSAEGAEPFQLRYPGWLTRPAATLDPAPPPDQHAAGRPGRAALVDVCGVVWMYVNWHHVTKQMTTEQREAFADAVDEWSTTSNDGRSTPADRWWRRDPLDRIDDIYGLASLSAGAVVVTACGYAHHVTEDGVLIPMSGEELNPENLDPCCWPLEVIRHV